MSALGSLIAHFEARGEHDAAQAYARKQVALEPWNEEAHRTLMRALAMHGQRNAALHQFQTCCRILREELGVEPSEETVFLYEAIRSGRVASGERVSPSSPPPTRMRFVARESQMARLNSALTKAMAGAGDVIFVSGEAGSGKTALLGEFTLEAMHRHASVLVAGGTCSAPSGMGDPYQPFREILQLLTGDIEAKRASAALTPEHAHRLWTADARRDPSFGRSRPRPDRDPRAGIEPGAACGGVCVAASVEDLGWFVWKRWCERSRRTGIAGIPFSRTMSLSK